MTRHEAGHLLFARESVQDCAGTGKGSAGGEARWHIGHFPATVRYYGKSQPEPCDGELYRRHSHADQVLQLNGPSPCRQ